MSKLANVSIASEDPHRSKCLVNCFNAGPTISVMPFEGFPCVLKPPVNADLIGYNIGNIVTNHKTAIVGAGIKIINQTFGPRGVLDRYRNICQLRHLGRAKCKHIPWGVQVCTNWFLIILTNITTQAELCSQPNSSPMLSLSSSVSANCHGMRQLT